MNANHPRRGNYSMPASSALFPELWSLHVAWISVAATACLQAQHASAGRVMLEVAQTALAIGEQQARDGKPPDPLELQVTIFQFPDLLRAPRGPDVLVVRGAQDLFRRVSLPEQAQPDELSFELIAADDPSSDEQFSQPVSHSHTLPNRHLQDLWGYILAGAYERTSGRIRGVHGADPRVWPPELQMFYHIRNACSHGGKFRIFANRFDAAKPPAWKDRSVPDRSDVEGMYALDEFMPLSDVFPFVHDISRIVDEMEG